MENESMNADSTPGYNHKPKNKIWVGLVIIVLVLAAGFLVRTYLNKQKIEAQKLAEKQKLEQTIARLPANLVLSKDNATVIHPQAEKDFELRSNEALPQDALSYTVNKEQKEVVRDIFNQAVQKNWIFSKGSQNIPNGIVFKFANGDNFYLAKITGGLEPLQDKTYKTDVIIIKLVRK